MHYCIYPPPPYHPLPTIPSLFASLLPTFYILPLLKASFEMYRVIFVFPMRNKRIYQRCISTEPHLSYVTSTLDNNCRLL